MDYTTVSGTAQVGTDFLTAAGSVRFLAGVTNLAITVPVLADSLDEQIEQFTLVLGNPTGLAIDKGTGVGTILNTPVPHQSSFGRAVEPLSPSSRSTDLVISEIMYNPPSTYRGVPGLDLDWVEVCNAGAFPIDVSGYSLSGDILCAFPENTILAPGAYLVAADKPASFASVYGFTNVLSFSGSLPDNGGRIRVRNRAGRTLLEVNYDNQSPWPLLANGKGRSLVLARPSYGENDPRAWQASEQEGGSPLAPEPRATNSLRLVRINELLANSQLPDFDFIELYNQSDRDVDISGCILSDSPDTPKFVFQGTTIPARSYLALDEVSLDFKLSLAGDTVYFRAPSGEVLDVAKYEAQLPGVSFGRFPGG